MEHYDAIIIGSGQAGNPLAKAFGNAGRKTAIIERAFIGGTCINYGCTPTKTMFNSARVAYLARRAADYGVHHGEVTVNMREVRERKQRVVEEFRESGLKGIEKTKNLDLLSGDAKFVAPHEIEVQLSDGGKRSIGAEKIFINTGGRPAQLQFDGIDSVPTLDSTSIMELDELPEHLLVLGGGYIGLEFGQMFRRFGSEVTIVQRIGQLLGREDTDVADAVLKVMEDDGIKVLLKTEAVSTKKAGAEIELTVRSSEGEQTLRGTQLLVAVGRKPNTEDLNLAAAGIETDRQGNVIVNNKLETNVPGVYALGDVKGGPQFTHISYDDFRIIRTNLLEDGDATTDGRFVPYTVFIDPQLGRIGISEAEAKERGLNFRVAKLEMSHVARAIEMSETRGFLKAIVDAETKQILGATVLGVEGGEIMSMFEIAMMGKLPYTVLKDGIFAHPTLAESLNNLFMGLLSE
ncbi:MAG TPA: mercuric reductase [Pyrinomonadaceae bacterium]|nr:mercuric reductase [Pyrinomonadaceae bacterium]